jgi:hypothetical protein
MRIVLLYVGYPKLPRACSRCNTCDQRMCTAQKHWGLQEQAGAAIHTNCITPHA